MVLPQTERVAERAEAIDRLDGAEALARMIEVQIGAVESLRAALAQIEAAARLMAETLRGEGRLVYAAAGSSGLMALADGAELPGTFGIAQDRIAIRMAGGVPVDGAMTGETEDDVAAARAVLSELRPGDLVIALSASGTTPYPLAIARGAHDRGARVVSIACNPGTPLLDAADVAICLATPPEALAGSTRMGAGTAQKAALNLISTRAGVLLGHVHDGMMVNLRAENAKLRGRARAIVARVAGVSEPEAAAALDAAGGAAKPACLVAMGAPPGAARRLLDRHDGHLAPAMAALRTTSQDA
ncbi:N-acetylmuramic acid 6-phosphate etherase [Limimaricola pyoseonensis]|uniref:N-acetylmuramic acid 6-phosphate etherase n=1 Tax=Limimaricola pyoseonensis TaxID=521013 RepID=A0A1G7L539_9RHOB|nr:N-acetylmuramic acid 6-phosphate etherase [Limimaricola pyoseonensis]SDF44454.1 N-acetylmuramic acid 6-phosphate etherase [Limimaricola pyoseonensis]